MSTENGTTPSRPPQNYFSVGQRLFRGYGPAVALVAVVTVLAIAVPSKVQKATNTASSGNSSSSSLSAGQSSGSARAGSTAGSGAGTATAANAAAASSHSGAVASGSGGSAGTAAKAGRAGPAGSVSVQPGRTAACAGQRSQVPGDPYSPPCIAFSGSNGGATSSGVTANAINVSVRMTSDQSFQQTLAQLAGAQLKDTNADNERTLNALAQYFNTHFQFYGRKIVLHFFNGQGSLSTELLGNGQQQAEADALTAKQMRVFADLTAESEPYAADLAGNGIMAFGDPYMSRAWHQQHAPYTWSIATDGTDVATLSAAYAVAKLCPQGTPAAYAGGSLQNKPRKFALLAPENSWYQESVDVAQQYMASHGCQATKYTYTLDLGTESQQASSLIAKLKADGVTTVICGCDPIFPVYLSGQGAQQSYLPEFIVTGTALTDADYTAQLWNQQFAAHAFGISPNAPEVPYTQTIGYEAYKTVDPSTEPAFFVNIIYAQLDELAIGIEMAGPHLTPTTFQQGMFNYPARLGPMGLWGFSPAQYTIPDDVREICWNPSATSPFNGKQGAYMGTSNARWTLGQIPKGKPGCPLPAS